MSMTETTMIGLSDGAHQILKRLKEDRHFNEMIDAYRFGIALALAYGVQPEELSNRQTIYSVATLDPDNKISAAVRTLVPASDVSVYRTAERLAEWGVLKLGEYMQSGEIDFDAIFSKVLVANSRD